MDLLVQIMMSIERDDAWTFAYLIEQGLRVPLDGLIYETAKNGLVRIATYLITKYPPESDEFAELTWVAISGAHPSSPDMIRTLAAVRPGHRALHQTFCRGIAEDALVVQFMIDNGVDTSKCVRASCNGCYTGERGDGYGAPFQLR